MTYAQFSATLTTNQPPQASSLLRALWYAAHQRWEAAHEIAQAHDNEATHNWLHAYLHRQEGDHANAAYWYRRAGRTVFAGSLAAELDALIRHCTT